MYNQDLVEEMEHLVRQVKFLEARNSDFEEKRFVVMQNLKYIQLLNSHGKTKEIHDELELMIKDLEE
jgi:hypothetical protein